MQEGSLSHHKILKMWRKVLNCLEEYPVQEDGSAHNKKALFKLSKFKQPLYLYLGLVAVHFALSLKYLTYISYIKDIVVYSLF